MINKSLKFEMYLTGNRYRFRLISAAILNCPISFSIQDHYLTIISADGHPVKPFNTTSLVIYPGEFINNFYKQRLV